MFEKLLSFTKKVQDLPDQPTLTPNELKAQFDAAPEELRVHLNKTIDDVQTAITDLKEQEDWIPIVLQNGWVPFNATGYPNGFYKNEMGEVKCRGMIRGGAADTLAFTLPEGYRPHSDQFFILYADASQTSAPSPVIGRAGVKSNGQVLVTGASNYVSLSNIVFRAEK
jgi:hypothetical protein